ncbi:MAG: hypothetical protein M3374_04490 [Pseudomonadota bacterium]|nr:hypothetical protein [Pseudomonadota bacterium]
MIANAGPLVGRLFYERRDMNIRTHVFLAIVLTVGCDSEATRDSSVAASQNGLETTVVQAPATASIPLPASEQTSNHGIASGGHSPPSPRASSQPYLRTESKLLQDQGTAVSSAAVQAALLSDDFDNIALAFKRDSATDTDAQDMTALYRSRIRNQLGDTAHLRAFNCGTSLCIGSIRVANGNDAYSVWADKFFDSPETPNYIFTDVSKPLGNNEFENRFFFSTDPNANAVAIPRGSGG